MRAALEKQNSAKKSVKPETAPTSAEGVEERRVPAKVHKTFSRVKQSGVIPAEMTELQNTLTRRTGLQIGEGARPMTPDLPQTP